MAGILVSSCLLGCRCRYKGDVKCNEAVLKKLAGHTLIAICPEQSGGLATPRDPSEIRGDRVVTCNGVDVTAQYRQGAENTLLIARLNHVDFAVLKARSPSCGKGIVYDGTFTGTKTGGNGITAGLLLANGIPVYTEEELDLLPI